MIAFLALLLASSVLAGPAFVPSHSNYFLNATAAKPTGVTTLAGACDANCSYTVAPAYQYSWTKVQVTATVTYAVAYVIINNRTNTTSTSTSYVALPSGYTLPPTNAAGTHIEEWTVTEPVNGVWSTFATNITYPSMYTSYPSSYQWWGIVPTTAAGGATTCSWAPWYFSGYTTSTSTLSKTTATKTTTVISYHTVATGASVNFTSVQPFGPNQPTPDAEDPLGYLYKLDYADTEKLTGVPPGNTDGVIEQCSFGPTPVPPNPDSIQTAAPAAAFKTASFLIATSTIHDDSAPSSSSSKSTVKSAIKSTSKSADSPTTVPASTAAKSVASDTTLKPLTTNPQSPNIVGDKSVATDKSLKSIETESTVVKSVAAATTLPDAQPSEDSATANPTTAALISGLVGAITATGASPEPAATTAAQGTQPAPVAVQSDSAPAAAVTAGGIAISQDASSNLVAGGQTLQAGSSVILGSGDSTTAVVLQTNGGTTQLAVGGSQTFNVPSITQAPSAAAPAVATFAGATVSQNGNSDIVVGGQTLQASAGSAVTVGSGDDAQVYSIQTNNGATELVAGGSTLDVGQLAPSSAQVPLQTVIQGSTLSQNAQGEVVVGSQTLAPGSAVTIGSGESAAVVQLQTSNGVTQLIADGTTTTLPTASAGGSSGAAALSPGAVVTVGGQTYSANSASQLVVDGQTLAVGGSSVTLGSGEVVALQTGSSGQAQLVVDGTTTALPTASAGSSGLSAGAFITVGGQTFTANSASQLVIDGQTLSSGSSITLGSGEVVALQTGSSGQTQLVVDGTTAALPTASAGSGLTAGQAITVGGQTFTANSASQLVIDGQTLSSGSSITLGSGEVVALQTDSSGQTQLVVDGTTAALPTASAGSGLTAGQVITVGGQTFTANSASQLVVDGQTLTGGSITLGSGASKTVVSLQTAANGQVQLVVGDKTTNLPGSTSYFATTAAGATISRNAQSQIIVNGQTLTPGATITIGSGSSKTTIALQTSDGKTALVVDGKTTTLGQSGTSAAAKTTSSSGLGGAIISGLGGTGSGSGSATATGSAASSSSSGAAAPLRVVSSSSSSLVWMGLIWTLGLVRLV